MRPSNIEKQDICSTVGIEMKDIDKIEHLFDKKDKKSEQISDIMMYLTDCYTINPQVLWVDVIKPIYIKFYDDYTQQSWRSASGNAFEVFLATYYTTILPNEFRVRHHGRNSKKAVLEDLSVADEIGAEKIDLTVEFQEDDEWYILGCPHVKTSLRERVYDVKSASRVLQSNSIFSPFITLDAQDELGAADRKNETRKVIEEDEIYDNMYSYNTETEPTVQVSKSQIKVVDLRTTPDVFTTDIIRQYNQNRNSMMKYPVKNSKP